MKAKLHLPAVLTVVALTGAATIALTTGSCGDDSPPRVDAACVEYCFDVTGSGNCPFPTCATGSNHDQCPPGCDVGV